MKWTLDTCTAVTDADSAWFFSAATAQHREQEGAGAFLQHGDKPKSHTCMIYFRQEAMLELPGLQPR